MWAFVATGISLVAAIASLTYAWFAWRHARDAQAAAIEARRLLDMELIAGDLVAAPLDVPDNRRGVRGG
ncbi:hypothetical protein LCGC14_2898890 [marine sediment metagenome]|uniref:Uncharacterized protein n=1 Tax=marine sediment metagenome TaxID=412755 RepID=A0A0F8XVG4_9ZZZZ